MMQNERVVIMMATYNGGAYVAEQIDSFCQQTHANWVLCASDDGSIDNTVSILQDYQQQLGRDKIEWQEGPKCGYAANFLSLLHHPTCIGSYYAYSDQDDRWMPDKLQRAVAWLKTIPSDVPALYCSRTEFVSADGKHIGYSTNFKKGSSFLNALVQNLGGGNTMVFNQAACDKLRLCPQNLDIAAHDWWTYLLVTGAGGVVHYDATPTVQYRQHTHAQLGMNTSWRARFARIMMLWDGVFKQWNDKNCLALHRVDDLLTDENRALFQRFVRARESSFGARLRQLWQLGVYRQTGLGQLGLCVAAFCHKL